jgi:hypothetical protein
MVLLELKLNTNCLWALAQVVKVGGGVYLGSQILMLLKK